jgi:capsule biosynthesis phosphatase
MDKLLVIDLDGTICEQTTGGDAYWTAKPKQDVIDRVNELYGQGWYVTIHTARGMRTCHSDLKDVERRFRMGTENWLVMHMVKYDDLIFGKPPGEMYVDDRGMTPDEFVSRKS